MCINEKSTDNHRESHGTLALDEQEVRHLGWGFVNHTTQALKLRSGKSSVNLPLTALVREVGQHYAQLKIPGLGGKQNHEQRNTRATLT